MKQFIAFTASLLIASSTFAQEITSSPNAPTAPTVQPVTMAPAGATSYQAVPASTTLNTAPAAPAAQPADLNKLLGKLAGNSDSQQKLGQVMVIGTVLGCTQKSAGKQATDAFYQEMQTLGKQVEGYCKSGNATQARALVLSTLAAKQNDPVTKSLLTCYEGQKAQVMSLGGPKVAADAEHYARWVKDPAAAKTEMQESDVCRKSK